MENIGEYCSNLSESLQELDINIDIYIYRSYRYLRELVIVVLEEYYVRSKSIIVISDSFSKYWRNQWRYLLYLNLVSVPIWIYVSH